MDLFHDCVKDLSEKIAKMMGINSRIKRMDSLMIEANIRTLSRIELLYSCVARAVKYHHGNHTGIDPVSYTHLSVSRYRSISHRMGSRLTACWKM